MLQLQLLLQLLAELCTQLPFAAAQLCQVQLDLQRGNSLSADKECHTDQSCPSGLLHAAEGQAWVNTKSSAEVCVRLPLAAV